MKFTIISTRDGQATVIPATRSRAVTIRKARNLAAPGANVHVRVVDGKGRIHWDSGPKLSEQIDWSRFNKRIIPILQARGVADIQGTRTPIMKGDTRLKVLVIHGGSESIEYFSENELRLAGVLR